MKRRAFLSAAAISLFTARNALAAPNKPAAKPSAKPAAKSGTKPVRGKFQKSPAPQPVRRSPLNTADHTVIDAPPPGSSASRLPPVKAPDLPELWQDFEVTTTLSLNASHSGPLRLWVPLPLNQDTLYQRNLGYEWRGNAESVRVQRLPDGEQEILLCQWPAGSDGQLTLINRISIAERDFDVSRRSLPPEREDILRRHLRETPTMPNDGPIYDLAMKIISRIKDPVAQAKAIFDWVTENSAYLPDLPGGGTTNVKQQLATGRFGGGSADIAALFVSLCRSLGIPARLVFGLRIDRSLMTDALSANPDDLTRAQHCRAEFYVPGYSWIPVDPADVCRADSRMGLNPRDLNSLRRSLFGAWEMNWMAYGQASELTLPGTRETLPFFNQPAVIRNGDKLSSIGPGHSAVQQFQIRSQRRLTAF